MFFQESHLHKGKEEDVSIFRHAFYLRSTVRTEDSFNEGSLAGEKDSTPASFTEIINTIYVIKEWSHR